MYISIKIIDIIIIKIDIPAVAHIPTIVTFTLILGSLFEKPSGYFVAFGEKVKEGVKCDEGVNGKVWRTDGEKENDAVNFDDGVKAFDGVNFEEGEKTFEEVNIDENEKTFDRVNLEDCEKIFEGEKVDDFVNFKEGEKATDFVNIFDGEKANDFENFVEGEKNLDWVKTSEKVKSSDCEKGWVSIKQRSIFSNEYEWSWTGLMYCTSFDKSTFASVTVGLISKIEFEITSLSEGFEPKRKDVSVYNNFPNLTLFIVFSPQNWKMTKEEQL